MANGVFNRYNIKQEDYYSDTSGLAGKKYKNDDDKLYIYYY